MAEKIASLAKNTSYFTLALIAQKIISLGYFTIYARELGPADLGKYYFALSFTTIFSIALDLGLTNLLTREVAKDQSQAGRQLSIALGGKLLLSALTLIIILAITSLGHYEPLIVSLIWVATLSMLADSFTTLLFGFNRAFHNLKFESINAVVSQAITLIVSLLVFHWGGGLVPLMWAQVASSFFALAYALFIIKRVWSLSLKPSWNLNHLRNLLLLALPFGLYAIAQRIYNYLDSVLLYQLAGDSAVGIYQIPFRAVTALQFLPMAFIASLYPALSHYWRSNKDQLLTTFERAINYSLIIATPLALGLAAIATPVIKLFAPEFSQAIVPLQISGLTVFFMFVNYPVGSLLNACDRQSTNTRHMIIAAITSIMTNLWLIPLYGVMGAITSAVLSSALLFALNWRLALELLGSAPVKLYLSFAKALAAGLVMAGIIFYLPSELNILLVITIGALSYFLCLFALKGFRRSDITSILQSFKKWTTS